MARVLLTGAQGFTGRYLTEALQKGGYEVVELRSDITCKEAILEELEGQRVDYVIHLAGISFPPQGEDLDVYKVNLFGTQNLLEALDVTGQSLQKLIVASTSNVYGNADSLPLGEREIPRPISHYALSKYCMEQVAWRFSERFPLIITRPFNYTGIGQPPHFLIPKIVEHFRERRATMTLGNLDVWRDFSDVRWVGEAYKGLLESEARSVVVNLCSGAMHSLREIVEYCTTMTSWDLEIRSAEAFKRQGEITKLVGDNSQLYRLVPCLPQPYDFRDTLRWMLEGA